MKRFSGAAAILMITMLLMTAHVFAAPKNGNGGTKNTKSNGRGYSWSTNLDGKLAAEGGLGYVIPLGDMRNFYKYAISMPLSLNYVFNQNVTFGADAYAWLLTSVKSPDKDTKVTFFQIGADSRYWFTKSLEGIYAGGGLGISRISVKTSFGSKSETDAVLVLKAGYVYNITKEIAVDGGLRYDAVKVKDFADQPVTIYVMGMYRF